VNLKEFVQSLDINSYDWLIHRSVKMQHTMGAYGVFAHFKPPYQNYAYPNYQIIVNTIPLIHQSITTYGLESLTYDYTILVHEAILRHIGVMEDERECLHRDMKNPFTMLRECMQSVLSLPLFILFSFGLLNHQIYDAISSSRILKIVAGLIGFLGTVVGLATEWEQFVNIIKMAIRN
jgi:hypothetical protein